MNLNSLLQTINIWLGLSPTNDLLLYIVATTAVLLTIIFPRHWIPRTGAFIVTAIICFAWLAALVVAGESQPKGRTFDRMEIKAGADRVSFGAKELHQNTNLLGSAAEAHVGLRRVNISPEERGTTNSEWRISNIAANKNLLLRYFDENSTNTKIQFLSSRFFLKAGDKINLRLHSGDFSLYVEELDRDRIKLRSGDTTYSIMVDGRVRSIARDEAPLVGCEGAAKRDWFRRLKEKLRYSDPTEVSAARFGGPQSCWGVFGAAIPVGDLALGELVLRYVRGIGFAISGSSTLRATVERSDSSIGLSAIEHPERMTGTDGQSWRLESFVAGYSRYNIDWAPQNQPSTGLAIKAGSKPQRLHSAEFDCVEFFESARIFDQTEGIVHSPCKHVEPASEIWETWIWPKDESVRLWPTGIRISLELAFGAAVVLLFIVKALVGWLLRQWPGRVGLNSRSDAAQGSIQPLVNELRYLIAMVGFAVLVLAFLLYQVPTDSVAVTPVAPYLPVIAWIGAALAVATSRGGTIADGLLFAGWTALVAIGHIALVAMALNFEETRYLRFADDTSLAVMATAGLTITVTQIAPSTLASLMSALSNRRETSWNFGLLRVPFMFWALLIGIGFFLAVWAAFGTETGIAGLFQPSEIMKLLTVLVLAVAVTLALDRTRNFERTELSRGDGGGSYMIVRLWSGFKNHPAWPSFAAIILLLGVILVVPVSRNDLSPLLVIAMTSILSFVIIVVIQQIVSFADRRFVRNQRRRFPHGTYRRIRSTARRNPIAAIALRLHRIRVQVKTFLTRPETWLLILPLGLAAILIYQGTKSLENIDESRAQLIDSIGVPFEVGGLDINLDTPLMRFISWIEFNAARHPEQAAQTGESGLIAIEFVDTAHQVSRSRNVVALAGCTVWPTRFEKPATDTPSNTSPTQRAAILAADTGNWINRTLVDDDCHDIGANAEQRARIAALRVPAVQNDFIGAWLVAYYGRDGATIIGAVQWTVLVLALTAGFLVMRWTPGQAQVRPAATTAAYASIGYAIMLALQWGISWCNTLGIVPVMGQPSTFLSHGPSHFLLFGTPAMLFILSALRLRAAFETRKRSLDDRNPDLHLNIPWWIRPRRPRLTG